MPRRAEIRRDVYSFDREVTCPSRPAQCKITCAGCELGAIRGVRDDTAHRHGLEDLEILRVSFAARYHWLDGNPVARVSHAGAVMLLVPQRDLVEPLVRQ